MSFFNQKIPEISRSLNLGHIDIYFPGLTHRFYSEILCVLLRPRVALHICSSDQVMTKNIGLIPVKIPESLHSQLCLKLLDTSPWLVEANTTIATDVSKVTLPFLAVD